MPVLPLSTSRFLSPSGRRPKAFSRSLSPPQQGSGRVSGTGSWVGVFVGSLAVPHSAALHPGTECSAVESVVDGQSEPLARSASASYHLVPGGKMYNQNVNFFNYKQRIVKPLPS